MHVSMYILCLKQPVLQGITSQDTNCICEEEDVKIPVQFLFPPSVW